MGVGTGGSSAAEPSVRKWREAMLLFNSLLAFTLGSQPVQWPHTLQHKNPLIDLPGRLSLSCLDPVKFTVDINCFVRDRGSRIFRNYSVAWVCTPHETILEHEAFYSLQLCSQHTIVHYPCSCPHHSPAHLLGRIQDGGVAQSWCVDRHCPYIWKQM